MDTKKFVIGTLVGGVVLWVSGYLIFTLAFGDFYAANRGSATGVQREQLLEWAIFVGSLAYAALVTLGIGSRGGVANLAEGAKIGAIVGFLAWSTADFTLYGVTNTSNLTRVIVDSLLEAVHGGIGGAAIGVVLAKMSPSGK